MIPEKTTLDALRIERGAARSRESRGWMVIPGILLVGLAAGAAWWFTHTQPLPVRTIAVRELVSGEQKTLLNASGYVTARRAATVSSKVTGKVIEVLIEEGMRVEPGQVLARIDASNVEASYRLAEAQLEASRSSLEETRVLLLQAERELVRISELAASKIAAASDLDRGEADVNSLKARLSKQFADISVAEKEVALWKQQLEDTIVRAPFAGIVTVKNAQPGEMISPMSAGGSFTRTGICTLVDMNSLEIEVDVNESYINRVEGGQKVEATLDAYPDWRIPAKVIAIIPAADRQKATVKVRVGFEKLDPRVLPDMGIKVAFQGGAEAASVSERRMTLPKTAVRKQQDGHDIVWVAHERRAERRAVTLGASQGDEVSVTAGLSAGEKVIIDAPATLKEDTTISEIQP